ncbi:methionyl-tRNA formyltransferase [Thiohalocapsa halophila]|uniref:Methionyl-tRNA formyltransferase n=2 Tax=Thiohalocapsa halophila TaxID=69359 RepID=A0ABS1CN63_9GAMM|nr:methionyl-tRNA formyltransferase [Thiohalocapsa halophila]
MDWQAQGHQVTWAHSINDAQTPNTQHPTTNNQQRTTNKQHPTTNLCFCLSFSQLVPAQFRAQFHHTLVVHESDLPQGKGWSPLTWQIVEGKQRIPVTLIEAADRVDSGAIYAQRWLQFQGHELIDELRAAQAQATHDLCRWFVDAYPYSAAQGRRQQGEETFYPRRGPADSRLDPEKAVAEQFELLRVVDNARYPAFFDWRGRRYTLSIHGQT